MKFASLLSIAPFSGTRVTKFPGQKPYLSTGSLQDAGLDFEHVTYDSRPSRADIIVRTGDILFARMKNTNKVLLVSNDVDGLIVSTGFSVHRPIYGKLYGEYLFKYLKSNLFQRQKNKYCTGAIQPAITNEGLQKIQIPLPSFDEQIRIATILTRAERLIAKRKESIKLLDQLLKSNFLEMFGDPVRNERGWDSATIEELCSRVIDCPHNTPKYSNEITGYYCIRSADIQNGYLNLNSTLQVSIDTYTQRNIRHVPAFNDIVFTREGGRLGNSARIPKGVNICLGQRIMLFIVQNKKATSEFLWAVLNSYSMQVRINNLVGGGAAPRVNIKDIIKLKVCHPPLTLQNQFTSRVEKVESIKAKYTQSLAELENLCASLSQRAFKGELDLNRVPVDKRPAAKVTIEEHEVVSPERLPREMKFTNDHLNAILSERKGEKFNFRELQSVIDHSAFDNLKEGYYFEELPKNEELQNIIIKNLESSDPKLEQVFDILDSAKNIDTQEKMIVLKVKE